VIEFRVNGLPVPQGSMKVINGHIIHSQGSVLAVWRSTVALAAKTAGARPIEGAIVIECNFFMPRPKTVKRPFPSVAPDLDKLIRGVLDALTAVAYVDDGQVCEIVSSKNYSEDPGVQIKISQKNFDNSLEMF
jgi:crossover junction endodeoxyribonuclease RusA